MIFSYFDENDVYVVNLGDSRAVLAQVEHDHQHDQQQQQHQRTAVRLSFDHKPLNEEEESRIRDLHGGNVIFHANSNTARLNGSIAVSRSLGDFYMKPYLSDEAFINHYSLHTRDSKSHALDEFIIMGCDGLWDEVSDQFAVEIVSNLIEEFVAKNSSSSDVDCNLDGKCCNSMEEVVSRAAHKLRDYAFLLGSEDNISVIVIYLA